jgi:feruloyl-CoA synthase
MNAPRYRDAHVGGCLEAVVEQRADGATLMRSTEALRGYPPRLTDRLE